MNGKSKATSGVDYKAGAIVSVVVIDDRPIGVIVVNPGEKPRFYRYEGGSEELLTSADGRIVLPILVKPGSSLSVVTTPDHFEIEPAQPASATRH